MEHEEVERKRTAKTIHNSEWSLRLGSEPTGRQAEDEGEIFRSVWKYYKRNAQLIRECVQAVASGSVAKSIPCLDFDHPSNSPPSLQALVHAIQPDPNCCSTADVAVNRAYAVLGRPGFIFIPNPFVSEEREIYWLSQLALHYVAPGSSVSRRNIESDGSESAALQSGLRWATPGRLAD